VSDLVDRLRRAGKSAYDPLHVLMQEAADEIERLSGNRERAMEKTWDEIERMLEVRVVTRSDQEWDEAKLKAVEATIEAIISKLSRVLPDPVRHS
jgi:hypothetical protein